MEKLGSFNQATGNDAMRVKILAQATLHSCKGMREKFTRVALGKSKVEWQTFRDPSRPGAFVKVKMERIDDKVSTQFAVDDSKVWAECAKAREIDDAARKAGATFTGCGAQWFICTFLLEIYLLFKYGLDLRDTQWQDPKSEDGRKLSYIMDHDEFAMRYKTTNMRESIGMVNPFGRKQ